jgi:hypothetical protein
VGTAWARAGAPVVIVMAVAIVIAVAAISARVFNPSMVALPIVQRNDVL